MSKKKEEILPEARVFMRDGVKVVEATVKILDKDISSSVALEGRDQPRGITAPPGGVRPYFRASMEAELQKFGKPEYSQLALGEDADIQEASLFSGLEGLTENQDKAIHAIQKLLADTDYLGNLPGENRTSTEFKWTGYMPTLSFTPTEYFDAYPGLERAGDGRYHGSQVKSAIEALKSFLDIKYSFSYNRPVFEKGKKSYKAVRAVGTLINQIGESFSDLTEEELEDEKAGKGLPESRMTRISITPSPILLAGIRDGWYLLKPVHLHAEVQALYPGKKYPPEVRLFLEWLLTLNKREMRISRMNLAYKLSMNTLIRNRKQSLIDKKISEALEVALKLEYLLSYEIQPTGVISMKLNPERIKRIDMQKKPGRPKKEEETE